MSYFKVSSHLSKHYFEATVPKIICVLRKKYLKTAIETEKIGKSFITCKNNKKGNGNNEKFKNGGCYAGFVSGSFRCRRL